MVVHAPSSPSSALSAKHLFCMNDRGRFPRKLNYLAVARVPLKEDISRDFMVHCLRSDAVQRHFLKETRTVSQPTLNISLIKTAPVIQPPLDLQRRFAAIVESIERQKVRLRTHLAELDTLFASLQSRAFNGQL